MTKILKTITSIVPGPMLAWTGEWVGIFERTFIVRPRYSPDAYDEVTATANALATCFTIISAYLLFDAGTRVLRRLAVIAVMVALLSLSTIFVLRYQLAKSLPRETAEILSLLYDISTVVFLIAAVLAVLFAVLSWINSRPRTTDSSTTPTDSKVC